MKRAFCLLILFAFIPVAHAQWRAAAETALEAALKVSGHSVDDAGRRVLLQELEKAAAREGDHVYAQAAKGGTELVTAAATHGDDVWRFAHVVPNATRALALNAGTLLPVARRLGPEVIEIEAKAPGLCASIASSYSDDFVREVARVGTAKDLSRLAGLTHFKDFGTVRKMVETGFRKEGTTFMERVKWQQILATGLSTASITAAYKVSNGFETVATDSPDVFAGMFRPGFLAVGCALGGAIILVAYRLSPKRKPRHA